MNIIKQAPQLKIKKSLRLENIKGYFTIFLKKNMFNQYYFQYLIKIIFLEIE